mmetsp:Transcript_17219/g.35022  ORF Transcript_17219/g.35022 Transcript_17219/m.35022 type:complete len:649 (-) Transcript_17219:552-2498(-)
MCLVGVRQSPPLDLATRSLRGSKPGMDVGQMIFRCHDDFVSRREDSALAIFASQQIQQRSGIRSHHHEPVIILIIIIIFLLLIPWSGRRSPHQQRRHRPPSSAQTRRPHDRSIAMRQRRVHGIGDRVRHLRPSARLEKYVVGVRREVGESTPDEGRVQRGIVVIVVARASAFFRRQTSILLALSARPSLHRIGRTLATIDGGARLFFPTGLVFPRRPSFEHGPSYSIHNGRFGRSDGNGLFSSIRRMRRRRRRSIDALPSIALRSFFFFIFFFAAVAANAETRKDHPPQQIRNHLVVHFFRAGETGGRILRRGTVDFQEVGHRRATMTTMGLDALDVSRRSRGDVVVAVVVGDGGQDEIQTEVFETGVGFPSPEEGSGSLGERGEGGGDGGEVVSEGNVVFVGVEAGVVVGIVVVGIIVVGISRTGFGKRTGSPQIHANLSGELINVVAVGTAIGNVHGCFEGGFAPFRGTMVERIVGHVQKRPSVDVRPPIGGEESVDAHVAFSPVVKDGRPGVSLGDVAAIGVQHRRRRRGGGTGRGKAPGVRRVRDPNAAGAVARGVFDDPQIFGMGRRRRAKRRGRRRVRQILEAAVASCRIRFRLLLRQPHPLRKGGELPSAKAMTFQRDEMPASRTIRRRRQQPGQGPFVVQ